MTHKIIEADKSEIQRARQQAGHSSKRWPMLDFPAWHFGLHTLDPTFLSSFTFPLCSFVPSNQAKLFIFMRLVPFMPLTVLTDCFTRIELRSPLFGFNASSKWLHCHCLILCSSSQPIFKTAGCRGQLRGSALFHNSKNYVHEERKRIVLRRGQKETGLKVEWKTVN